MKLSIDSIERAIVELGSPGVIWLRGHVQEHKLIPALYRFSDGPANECQIGEWYKKLMYGGDSKIPGCGLALQVAMHHNYVPSRLLSWTQSLHIALFCALVREIAKPTVFVMDPVALNARSNIVGIVKIDLHAQTRCPLFDSANGSSFPEYPVAFEGCSNECNENRRESLFTLHGTNKCPLEEQCPEYVRKVVLTEKEKSLVEEGILSGKWLL